MIWSFIWIALLFGGIGGFVYGIVDDAGGAIAIGVLSFLIGVIGVLITSRFLTAKTHRDGLFTVKGCHPDFLAEIRRAQQRMPLGERLEKIHG